MTESVYGYCPQSNCGAPGVTRERRMNGNDRCARGHSYASRDALKSMMQAKTMTAYTCGFMFDPDRGVVVLVEKNRPAWQAGRLNGIGGKIESGDASVAAAMVREFHEEAGVLTQADDWEEFATLVGPDYKVHMLRAFSDHWREVRTMESESVAWYPVGAVRAGGLPVVDQLSYLIPLALAQRNLQLPIVFNDVQQDEARAA